jgi:sulfatase maturation enzyme AslB (radical SAM superfamily)
MDKSVHMSDDKYVKVNPTYTEVRVSGNACAWENSWSEKYREYRRKWNEAPQKQIVGDFPIHLDLECTRTCNLRCPMCPRTIKIAKGENIEEGSMDFELFKKVVDEGSKHGLYSIKLSYLGEPLICRDVDKMVKYAKGKGIIDVMFNTNGVLLTKEISEKLIEAGLDKLFISFDSPVKAEYESIRIGANFERVIENVKRFVEMRNKKGLVKPIVRVSMVVMKENLHEVLNYIKLWSPIVDLIGFSDYVNPQGMDTKDRYTVKLENHANFVCPQLYQRLFVHWNGKIGLCCVDYDGELDLGNANDVSIRDVWLGEKMQKIRQLHNTGQWNKVPVCAKCHIPYI